MGTRLLHPLYVGAVKTNLKFDLLNLASIIAGFFFLNNIKIIEADEKIIFYLSTKLHEKSRFLKLTTILSYDN